VTVAIITDQHFGARKNSKLFHDYFLKFYNEIFFPKLVEENIKTVIDMGDTFDNRTGINYSALAWAKDNYYDRLRDMGIKVYTIVGNHTAYYKNTNSINAVDLLLREYDNVEVISEYREINIEGLKIAIVPWINSENQESTYSSLKKSKCPIVMGHLELQGFNPAALLDSSEYKDKIVKLIVRKKTKPKEFEKYVDKFMDSGVFDLKVVENFAFNESEDFNIEQSEDTLSILSRYLDESVTDIDKVAVKKIIKNIYQEACEVV